MNEVKISVIVPFYKTPQDGFDSCIESLISQTYYNLEILVIDDCSGYEWFKQLDDVAKLDPRITVVRRETNGGLSAVRNYGLKICTGEFVVFVDSDDVLHHYAIQYLYENILETGSDIAIGGLTITNTYEIQGLDEEQIVNVHIYDTITALEKMMTNSGFGSTACGRLAHKRVWECNGSPFIEGLLHEDLASTWEVVSGCQKICWIDANLYYYYQGGQSAIHSKTVSAKFCQDFLFALNNRNNGVSLKYPSLSTAADYSNLVNCPNIYMYACDIDNKNTSLLIKKEVLKLFKKSFKSGCAYPKSKHNQRIKMTIFKFEPSLFCLIYNLIRKIKGLRK